MRIQKISFSHLALGAKFMYLNDIENTIWVKIYPDLVAKWDYQEQDTAWVGQPVCSFNESDKDNEVRHIVEDKLSILPSNLGLGLGLGPGPQLY